MISDEALRSAAARSCEIYVDQRLRGYDDQIRHVFSPQFEKKIKKLKRKADHPLLYRSVQRVASVLLAILIGAGAWLAVDIEARAAVFGWIKGVYETFFIYRFDGKTEDPVTSNIYRPTWLPDGYTEFFADESTESILVVYTNETGEMLKVNYVQNPDETIWLIDYSQMEKSATKVNGWHADLLLSTSPDIANCILWTTPDNIAFYISAFLEEADLVKLAESIKKIE